MIVISYVSDIVKNTYDALAASDISKYLKPSYAVALKPNLVAAEPASQGATTHPEVVEGIILFLRDFGVKDIKIIESSWIGDNTKRAFSVCGYEELQKKYNVPLIDLKPVACTTLDHSGYNIEICNDALETDFLINVPVLKAHCQTNMTCCLKNLKGCIPDREKKRFHSIGLHKPIAILNALIKTGYCVVDGICGDLEFEVGGNPIYANRVIVGQNPVLMDSYCAELIGYNANDIEHLAIAKEIGVGDYYSPEVKLVELNAQNKPRQPITVSKMVSKYQHLIKEDSACSACYANLVHALHRAGIEKYPGGKIHIGQGFIGKNDIGIGIGNCAKGFEKNVIGCPPKATDIIRFFKNATENGILK